MRSDLVLGGSGQQSATSSAPGGIGTRGQAFDGDTMAVLAAAPTLLSGTGIDGLDAVGGSLGNPAYLRCGRCGGTVAGEQGARDDGQLVDYAPDSQTPRRTPTPPDHGHGHGHGHGKITHKGLL